MKVEIISIGDEIVSGQTLDTNSQWLSRELSAVGLEPSFHTTVGDQLDDGVEAFAHAVERADIVIATGGIGPTMDDLTRQVLAKVAGVELELRPEVEVHIRSLFARLGREMPTNNTLQAWFPQDSVVISNSEGTAPGIDMEIGQERQTRVFALPGVPYEMKEMWNSHVFPELVKLAGGSRHIQQRAIQCFGAGESQIESLLGDLTARGNRPRVGITASQSTITLRITAMESSESECKELIEHVTDQIRARLGPLVYSENGESLADVVIGLLNRAGQRLAIVDLGFGGLAGQQLATASQGNLPLAVSLAMPAEQAAVWLRQSTDAPEFLTVAAEKVCSEFSADMGVAIGPQRTSENGTTFSLVTNREGSCSIKELSHLGHSVLRENRTAKQILNHIRLTLLDGQSSVAGNNPN